MRPSSKKSPQDLSLVEYQSKGSPEDTSLRALNNKVENLEQSVVSILDLFKREREVGNSGAVEVQRRLDKLDYRMGQAES